MGASPSQVLIVKVDTDTSAISVTDFEYNNFGCFDKMINQLLLIRIKVETGQLNPLDVNNAEANLHQGLKLSFFPQPHKLLTRHPL